MIKLFYLPLWFFRTRILGKQKPLQSVVFITNKCNLQCKHCCIYYGYGDTNKSKLMMDTFEDVKNKLEYCYNMGSRFVDFEGGEPLL